MTNPNTRNPWDGLPYYCLGCNAGFAEYLACEQGKCSLESVRDAKMRAALHRAPPADKKAETI